MASESNQKQNSDRRVDEFKYQFSDVVLICHRPRQRPQTVWYLICPDCGNHVRFKKYGKNYWKANCTLCKEEFVITPSELHTTRFIDFSSIIGDVVR